MTTGPHDALAPGGGQQPAATAAADDPDERAELEADRREQRELDDGELGGEA